jgi:SAM-dependent methyltransferase
MSIDVVDLRNFYAQRLGVVARRFVGRGIRARFADTHGMRVLGVGYPTPYLGLFREEAERCLAFMPAAQGVVKWPSMRPTLAALVDEFELPLTDAAIDRIVLVHALEMAHDPGALLRECWRVLAAGGRLLAVVPNRRGLWARMDTTPFGQGRPYSRAQITYLLRDTWFTPVGWGEALYVPPVARGWFLRSAVAWERAGATISAPFAGVHIVEATKQVYRAIPARRERHRLVPTRSGTSNRKADANFGIGPLVALRRFVVVVAATLEVLARTAAMTAAATMQRKAVRLIVVAVLAVGRMALLRLTLRLLAAGDEGRQPIDVA